MSATFPRLLVATECWPNAPGGGAAVIRQMLKDWPADNLFWWSCLPERQKTFNRQVAGHYVATIPERMYPNRRWRGARSWLLEWIWVPWAARHLIRTLEMVKPDAIWVIPHCWSISPVAQSLPQSGLGFHITVQDFMDSRDYLKRYGPRRCRSWRVQAEELYKSAATRDATSHPMIADLFEQTGKTASQMLHAGLEQEDFDSLAQVQEPGRQKIPVRIAYAGTVVAQQTFSLFVKALAEIRHSLPQGVELGFFGDHSYRARDWFNPDWMHEYGNLPPSQLSEALKDYDWGFAPMEMTDDNPRYNRFSFPTKLITYLASGLPVVVLGHPESSAVKMASQYQFGICITDGDIENLKTKLLAHFSEPNPRIKYRGEIRRCAQGEFDARKMRAVLFDNFQKCAAIRRPGTFS